MRSVASEIRREDIEWRQESFPLYNTSLYAPSTIIMVQYVSPWYAGIHIGNDRVGHEPREEGIDYKLVEMFEKILEAEDLGEYLTHPNKKIRTFAKKVLSE